MRGSERIHLDLLVVGVGYWWLIFFLSDRDTEASVFSLASKEDMPEIVDISKAIFYTAGNDVTPTEICNSWLEKNPYTFFVVKYESKIVAYASYITFKSKNNRKTSRR